MKKLRSLLLCICAVLMLSFTTYAGNVHYTVEKISAFRITFSDKYYVRPMILTVYDDPMYWSEKANILDTWYTADSLTHDITGLKAGTYYVFMQDDPAYDEPAYVKHGPAQRYTIDVLEDMDPTSPNIYAITAETYLDFPEHENRVTITGDQTTSELAKKSPLKLYIYEKDGTYYGEYSYKGNDISVTGIPDGSYILQSGEEGAEIPFSVGYYKQQQTLTLTSNIALPMPVNYKINVSVLDKQTGEQIKKKATVTLFDSNGSKVDSMITSTGECEFTDLKEDIYTVLVEMGSGIQEEMEVNLANQNQDADVPVYVDIPDETCHVTIEFRDKASDTLLSDVVSFDLIGEDENIIGSYTAQGGIYDIDLAPGEYTVSAQVAGGMAARQEFTVSSVDTASMQVVYLTTPELPPAIFKIPVTFVDVATGRQIDGTHLSGTRVTVFDSKGGVVGTYEADADGAIAAGPLTAGDYTLSVQEAPDGYLQGYPETIPFTVGGGGQDSIKIPVNLRHEDLEPPVVYAIKVELHDTDTGELLPYAPAGVKLALVSSNGGVIGTYDVAENGTCVIDQLEAGDYKLSVVSAPDSYMDQDSVSFAVEDGYPETVVLKAHGPRVAPPPVCTDHKWEHEEYGTPHYKDGTTEVVVTRICTICGYEDEKEWVPTIRKEIEKSVSCTEPDILITYSDIFDGKSVLKDQEIKREEIPAKYTEHDWTEWKMTQEATEEQDGVKERHCTRCDVIEAVLIPHDGTDIGTPPGPLPADEEPGKEGEKESEEEKPASPSVKIGTSFTSGKYRYKVTAKNTVTFTGCTKKLKKVSIPSSVTYNGVKFSVTEIGKGAVKANAKLVRLSIPATIRKIGPEAFKACKNLKTIVIKTQKLSKKTLGANAFKGIHKKAVFKVPKAKKKAYKKLFKGYTVK